MLQVNSLQKFPHFLIRTAIILFFFIFCSKAPEAHAMKIAHYDYKEIYNALPSKFQKEEYIYKGNDIPYIAFATYNGNNDYKTSVKKTSGKTDFIYCVDYSKHIVFQKNFSAKNKLFNDELRTRLGLAFYYGTTAWGKKANSKFTTGNSILDYYMTQLVVHSLIYKYGDGKSNYGIQYSLLNFKANTGTLKKKTDELYKFCCNAKVTLDNGDFQSAEFDFNKPDTTQLLLSSSNSLDSSSIQCNTDIESSSITSFKRTISSKDFSSNQVLFENENSNFDSSFKIKLPLSAADQLEPGCHILKVTEQIEFKHKIAGFWKCSDSGFTDTNQEVGGLISYNDSISSSTDFEFLIGDVILYKKDSITGETITDAQFQLYQYNDTTGKYQYYKNLTFNSSKQRYESGNVYIQTENKKAKFKIIESKAGANYLNDWKGVEFTLTRNQYSYEYTVENQPVLGKLKVHKDGEKLEYSNNNFKTNTLVSLEGIKFSLFAKEDVYVKDKVFYKKNQKIVDLITDKEGNAMVDDLPAGSYFLKESSTSDIYVLDPESYNFTITRDNNRKYNEVSYKFTNVLKKCQIKLFKYYCKQQDTEQKKKIPLQGAKFGLYSKDDIVDTKGVCVLKKDSLIATAYSDKDGMISFNNLPYANYYLKELEAPKNFKLSAEVIVISKNDFQSDEASEDFEISNSLEKENMDTVSTSKPNITQNYTAYKEIINQQHTYNIKLTKYGEIFSGVKKETSEQGEYYSYMLKNEPLKNVAFSLYDERNNLISSGITDINGKLDFLNVEPGKYYYVEDVCPEEYLKQTKKNEITCESELFELEDTITNELCSINLSISKLGEQAKIEDGKLSYNKVPLQGVVFGIYQDFEYKFSDKEVLPKDSCVGYLVTDKNGESTYNGKLPAGSYYLKEQKTNPGYDLDHNTYSFTVAPKENQNQTIQFENNNVFENKLSKASVKIKKTDANTKKPLKNVEFTLYNDKDQIVGVYKTNKKGEIVVKDLPYGDYYFLETKCKNGYYSTNNKYRFTLQSSETIILNITNAPILKLGFEEHFKVGLIAISAIIIIAFILFIPLQKNRSQSTYGTKKHYREK